MRYEVTVQAAASQGGAEHKIEVDASDDVAAIVAATLKLEMEKGIDRWSFKRCVKVTS